MLQIFIKSTKISTNFEIIFQPIDLFDYFLKQKGCLFDIKGAY
jgi:hypothetical protein